MMRNELLAQVTVHFHVGTCAIACSISDMYVPLTHTFVSMKIYFDTICKAPKSKHLDLLYILNSPPPTHTTSTHKIGHFSPNSNCASCGRVHLKLGLNLLRCYHHLRLHKTLPSTLSLPLCHHYKHCLSSLSFFNS